MQAYAAALDKLAHSLEPEVESFDSFAQATASAESLEHFHLFRREAAPPAGASALDMHTDMGLFIVMTTAAYLPLVGSAPSEDAGRSPGLQVKLADGTVAEARFQPGSLIVMNGEGSNRWMNNPMGRMLLPPEHEVSHRRSCPFFPPLPDRPEGNCTLREGLGNSRMGYVAASDRDRV